MTSLSDLFPDGPRAGEAGAAVFDDHHTARRLRETIGEPRESGASARPLADTRELVDMVQAAARTAVPVSAGADASAGTKRRPRRRFDALTLSAVAVAAVTMVAAATVGGIQVATASPASSALESLEADEAAVQNAYQSLKTARDRLVADVEAQSAEIVLLRTALTETSTAPDPASAPDEGSTLAVADATALATALSALDAYAAGLASITVPELPTEYVRAEIDEDSLVEVGGAIDGVQERLVALDEATAETRAVRSRLDALRPPADVAVNAYAASFVPAADAAIARYPDAEQTLRTAASAAAARVASAGLWTADGRSALAAYRDAFAALAADQLRVEIDREESEGSSQPRRQQNGTQNPPPGGSTDPTPVDPGTPVTPVDPVEPVDPVDPETPPDGGGTP